MLKFNLILWLLSCFVHEHRITRTQARSITHTHARTRTGTRTQLRCVLGKFVWRKMLERWQPLSTIEIHMFHVQSEEANWINVAACIAVSCCPALSASCLVEQEAALLRGWAELLRHTRRMRNVAQRTHSIGELFILCDLQQESKKAHGC